MKIEKVDNVINEIDRLPDTEVYGKVYAVQGMMVEVRGIYSAISVGDRCIITARDNHKVMAEIVGFKADSALLMPFDNLDGVGPGCKVKMLNTIPVIYPDISWLGRVIDAMGNPVDGKGTLINGPIPYPIRGKPPAAHSRNRVKGKVDLGVRIMNTFLTMCKGQRMGIFAGSGVGKSTIMSMMARNTTLDVTIMGLIGERGREAKEFIEDDLGEEGLANTVVIMATSDQSPLMRRQSAYTTMAVAEYFRDLGRNPLCLMDSVTRFAMAQREISLSAGEPPANKGYTPTVFAELPRLLERAGPGAGDKQGAITGIFTVLVEGDDHNEPISDAVRGILDGHVVLDRAIADRGRFPAINVLRSISRVMPDCNSDAENTLINKARKYIASYEDMAELIRLGAYKQGSNPDVDEAIKYYPLIEEFLAQKKTEKNSIEESYAILAQILGMDIDGRPIEAQEQTAE